jgi:hypothetical protein
MKKMVGHNKGKIIFMNAYVGLIGLKFLSYNVILVEKVIEPAFILHYPTK